MLSDFEKANDLMLTRLTPVATLIGRDEQTAQLPWAFRGPRGHDFALMGLTFIHPALSTCLVLYVQIEVRLPPGQRVLRSDCCKKCYYI